MLREESDVLSHSEMHKEDIVSFMKREKLDAGGNVLAVTLESF